MSDQPKACPFCGKMPQGNNWHTYGKNPKDEMKYFCANHDCINGFSKAVTLDVWNTRPIEDGLRAQLEFAKNDLATRLTELAASQAEVERLRGIVTPGMKLCRVCQKESNMQLVGYIFRCNECDKETLKYNQPLKDCFQQGGAQ